MHVVRMSRPITCPIQRKDPLFHVLFGGNKGLIVRMIEEAVLNLAGDFPDDGVMGALQLVRPEPSDPLSVLQIKFFVLLNEDERMRSNLARVDSRVMTSVCPFKAERFYDALCDELIPSWVKDERVGHDEFVDKLREVYLCS